MQSDFARTLLKIMIERTKQAAKLALPSFKRLGTPKRFRRGHVRGTPPGDFTTIRMLRRAMARGYHNRIQPDLKRHSWYRRQLTRQAMASKA